MSHKPDQTIERSHGETYHNPNEWDVYEHGVYEQSSVLAGQPKRVWIDGGFKSPEEAKVKYPDANIIEGTTHIPVDIMTAHLPDEEDSW